jgi:hypothetical protein
MSRNPLLLLLIVLVAIAATPPGAWACPVYGEPKNYAPAEDLDVLFWSSPTGQQLLESAWQLETSALAFWGRIYSEELNEWMRWEHCLWTLLGDFLRGENPFSLLGSTHPWCQHGQPLVSGGPSGPTSGSPDSPSPPGGTPPAAPEPSSLVLMGGAALGLTLEYYRRCRRMSLS